MWGITAAITYIEIIHKFQDVASDENSTKVVRVDFYNLYCGSVCVNMIELGALAFCAAFYP